MVNPQSHSHSKWTELISIDGPVSTRLISRAPGGHCGGVRGEKKWERCGAVNTIAIDHLSLESSSSTEPMNSIMFVESSQMEKKKNGRLEDLLGVACRLPRGLASPAVVDWRM